VVSVFFCDIAAPQVENNHFPNSGSISVPLTKEECTITLTIGGDFVPVPSGGDRARRIEPGVAVRDGSLCLNLRGKDRGSSWGSWVCLAHRISRSVPAIGWWCSSRKSRGECVLQSGARRGTELAVEAIQEGFSSIKVIRPK